MENCLFCKFVRGEADAEKVFEDDVSLAFLDINPINRGHVLLIPKNHHENIFEIPDDTLERLSVNAKKIMSATKEAVSADGMNLGMNNGEAAGQVIFHAHLHLMPRFENDSHEHWKNNYEYDDGEISKTAEEIKNALGK